MKNIYIRIVPKNLVRFAFSLTDEGAGVLSCGGWRIWTSHNDTYISSKTLEGTWKASLHGDIAWRVAATSENMSSERRVLPEGSDRAPWKFAPTAFSDGKRLAFVVAVNRNALLEEHTDPREIQVPATPRWDTLTTVRIWMTEPGMTLQVDAQVGQTLSLSNGRKLWIEHKYEVVDGWDNVPQLPAASAMLEVKTPEKDGVLAPGFLISGVYLG
ncbi:MAG: hypothetical protein JWQ39_1195 [Glaciihabitans sp.]|nr:hypothetical protein [Glaciihabitans sp.]